MSRTSRRAAALGVALVLSVTPLLSACASGQDAVTRMSYAPSDGVEGSVGSVQVLNALVVAGPTGTDGTISMSVVNNAPDADRIVDISTDKGTVSYAGPTELAADQVLAFTSGAEPWATVRGLDVPAGDTIDLTLRFQNAGEITLQTVIYPAEGPYATITPQAG